MNPALRALLAAPALAAALVRPAEARIEHVIQISVDGLRGDLLHALVDADPAGFAGFSRLVAQGASTWNARCDFSKSETIPNHCTMITARPVDAVAGQPETLHHGYVSNIPGSTETIHANGNPAVPYKVSTFDVVHDRGLSTAFLYGKSRLDIIKRSYDATRGAPDTIGADNGRNKIDESILNTTTATLILNLTGRIADGSLKNYTFIHITDPDTAGHASGFGSAAWNTAVATVDGYIESLFTALDAHPALAGKVAIILTADHGGGVAAPGGGFSGNRGHDLPSAPENYVIPFFIWGPGFAGGTHAAHYFADRVDPAALRPDYAGPGQPLRNGDAPNLAMALLGLPPVPDGPIRAHLKSSESVTRSNSTITVSWPCYLTGYQLESSTSLGAESWIPVNEGIIEVEGTCRFTTTENPGAPAFFRLRPPS